jgi:hypothetical protein
LAQSGKLGATVFAIFFGNPWQLPPVQLQMSIKGLAASVSQMSNSFYIVTGWTFLCSPWRRLIRTIFRMIPAIASA